MSYGVILAADGFADMQLEYPYYRMREDAFVVDVVSPGGGDVSSAAGRTWQATEPLESVTARECEIVIVSGGTCSEELRTHGPTVDWLATHIRSDAITGFLDEAVGLLVDADALEQRLVTGPAALRDDLEAAGGTWTDEDVSVDGTVVTGRGFESLPFFVLATLNNLAIPQPPSREAMERPSWTLAE